MSNSNKKSTLKPRGANLYRDAMSLDPEIVAEIEKKGLSYRWINWKHYQADGFHKAGWVPYKADKSDNSSAAKVFGRSAEGYIVRKDSVLAVLPRETHSELKEHIRYKTERMTDPMKAAARQMKAAFREGEIKASITEEYDD